MKNILTVDETAFLKMPVIDTSIALLVFGIDKRFDGVKAKLKKLYGNVEVTADGKIVALDSLTTAKSIEVEAQPDFNKQRYNAADALRVTERLTRDDGCPWDRAQTHESIRINLIEEAYEAVDAIDKKDVPNMREEFGDVLLQSLLQSDIARRAGEFDFDDVCDELSKKLIGRHTFIFGEDSANNADDALKLWEKAKGIEKHYDSVKTQLKKLPDNFPALLLCEKVYKKLKKANLAEDPNTALDNAVKNSDAAEIIAAATALLAEQGMDAEVELNKKLKAQIKAL